MQEPGGKQRARVREIRSHVVNVLDSGEKQVTHPSLA